MLLLTSTSEGRTKRHLQFSTFHSIVNILTTEHPFLSTTLRLLHRGYGIEDTSHLVRRHLTTLHTTHLTSLTQPLEPKSKFPAFRVVNQEDIFLAIGIADRGAEDM